jgi:flagellar motor switch protein FliN/FliY
MTPKIDTILKLSVPVIVEVGERQMALDDVIALGPGAILELSKTAESELPLLINNQCIGQGVAVKVGENFGLRLTHLGSPKQRIEALAAGGAGGAGGAGKKA